MVFNDGHFLLIGCPSIVLLDSGSCQGMITGYLKYNGVKGCVMTGLGNRIVPLMPPTRVESCSLAQIGSFPQGLSCLTHPPFLLPLPLSLLPAF
ncbi:hypothetical protein EBZ35_05125, partial [bacterium]|nr:hypothetical protein [bacterium]